VCGREASIRDVRTVCRLALPEALRACLKIAWGPAARDFGCGQGGEPGASPQRAVTGEPTQATDKRPAARRVFAEKAVWLRCSSVRDRCGYPPSSCLAIRPFLRKQDSHGIFRQALTDVMRELGFDALRTFHVFPRARIDFHLFTGLDEQRSLNRDAGLQGHGFLDIVRRIAANASRRVRDG